MAKHDSITREQWQSLGLTVAADGTLFAPAVAPPEESSALAFRAVARSADESPITCTCCWADPDEDEACLCNPDDTCPACSDTDGCACCQARARIAGGLA